MHLSVSLVEKKHCCTGKEFILISVNYLLHSWVGVYLSLCSVTEISSLITSLQTLVTRLRMLLATAQFSLPTLLEQAGDY